MKLVRYEDEGKVRIGVVHSDQVFPLREAYAAYLKQQGDPLAEGLAAARIPEDGMVELIEGGHKAMQAALDAFQYICDDGSDLPSKPLSSVKLKAPLVPPTIICGGANFHDHLDETRREKPEEVEFFLKSAHAVIGPDETVEHNPKITHKYDYEVELGIIIGKEARNVPVEKAFDYIFGYTIFNDISARSQQVIPWEKNGKVTGFQLRFGEGKNYDTGSPIGPWIVTKDELSDVSNLALRTWLNDELRQNNNTSNLIWDVPNLVSYYSKFMTLKPGFLIATGTPGGPALGSDTELGADPYQRNDGVKRGGYMNAGDVMRLEIDGIGVLRNPIA